MLRRPHATYETADILTYAPQESIERGALPVMLERTLELDPGHPTVYLLVGQPTMTV